MLRGLAFGLWMLLRAVVVVRAIDEHTVSRYLPKRPVSDDRIRRWKAFLRNHRGALAGMDFFAVPTAAFSLLWVFSVIPRSSITSWFSTRTI